MFSRVILSVVLLGSSVSAVAQTTTTIVPPAAAEVTKKDPTICRGDSVTGSRMVHKTCHTKSQWAALRIEQERLRDRMEQETTSFKQDRQSTGLVRIGN